MTAQELRNHPEYKVCMDKIKAYRKGFEFTLEWSQIPRAKANALKIVMQDAYEQGLVDIIAFGLALDGTETSRTFKKL